VVRDPQGRYLRIERSDGKITRISTSSGQFAVFSCAANHRMRVRLT
jgi:hypothetical protein